MSKNIIITGGGRGIGAATARLAAARGWAVCVNYTADHAAANGVVAEIRDLGGKALAWRADVGNEADVAAMFEGAEAALGPISGLVNNAGITGPIGRFADTDTEMFRKVTNTNLIGSFYCAQQAVRRFQERKAGMIVNVSSVAAKTGAPEEYVHYAATKAAIESFTVGLAKEVATLGIRVNAVMPGSTLTEIHAAAGEPGRPERVKTRIPMQRLAEPEEIAAAIVWLLSDEASYITGAILPVTGGI